MINGIRREPPVSPHGRYHSTPHGPRNRAEWRSWVKSRSGRRDREMPAALPGSMSRPGARPMPECCPPPIWSGCRIGGASSGGGGVILREPRDVRVAVEASGAIVGFGSCGPNRGDRLFAGEVFTLYVAPDWQNQGIGRRLLIALFRRLVAAGRASAIVWVLRDNPSRFFYERLGAPSGEPQAARRRRLGGRSHRLWLARPPGLSRCGLQRGPRARAVSRGPSTRPSGRCLSGSRAGSCCSTSSAVSGPTWR